MKISDPTIEMTFAVNDSPFAGKEGKFVTSRNLRDRLEKELLKDVSLHVKEQGTDAFNVAGRGEMHLSILMETMRREGFEFSVSTPRVLTKVIDGTVCGPSSGWWPTCRRTAWAPSSRKWAAGRATCWA